MFVRECCSQAGNCIAYVSFFMACNDVQLPFTNNHGHAGFCDIGCCLKKPEEQGALMKSYRVSGVHILAGILPLLRDAAGKSHYFSTYVVDGEHEAVSEYRVGASAVILQKVGIRQ